MQRSKLLLSAMAGLLLSSATFVGWRVEHHLSWRPVDLGRYAPEITTQLERKHFVRFLIERISIRIDETATGPVRGALITSEVLSAYRSLASQYGEAVAIAGSYKVYALWDQLGADQFLKGFDGFDPEAIIADASAQASVDQLVQDVRKLAEMDFAQVTHPASEDTWTPEFGAHDGDADAGGYPLLIQVPVPDVPAAPAAGSAEDKLDLIQVKLATRLKSDAQLANSLWWQGSGDFEKGGTNGGFNPSDLWQSIAFAHAGQEMESEDFIALSSDLANVIRDAMISAWRIKYRDWTPRPNMRAGKLGNAIGNPPFPGYVSGHATAAAAAAEFLSSRDPRNAARYRRLADDSARSRIWGGVHVLSDNTAGIALGKSIAELHLGRQPDPDYRNSPIPGIDLVILQTVERLLDMTRNTSQAVKARLFSDLSFREIHDALPLTSTRVSPVEVHDTFSGSLALTDLDGDGLKDILVTGRNEVRLYRNAGGRQFQLEWESKSDAIAGAFFTHDVDGVVDGVITFGQYAPRWYARASAADPFSFDTSGRAVEGIPIETLASQGVVFLDADQDGDNDALVVESSFPFAAPSSESFNRLARPNYLLERTDEGYRFKELVDSPSGSNLAGGFMDINDDGVPDLGLISDAGKVQVRDGITGADLPLSAEIDKLVFGMSFTPISVAGRPAFHVSNIFHGPDWPYPEQDDHPDEFKTEMLVGWDAQSGSLVDLAHGALQYEAGEWGWGSAAGDLNGDGLEDLVSVSGFLRNSPYKCSIRVFLQRPDGSFAAQSHVLDFDLGDSSPRAIVLDDIDGDGDLDIIVNASQQVRIWENTSQIKSATIPVLASPTRGYLTQVIDAYSITSGQMPGKQVE